ncbi:MAG TPA: zinc-binding dehydrogenase [Spirochaetia bacterium]|nr:zinc-binding dehydrogenase [Spirochaetia bacterium]
MKALVKYAKGPGNIGLREIEEPRCAPAEVKIEVKACGICYTDIHILHDQYPWQLLLPLGHEYSGVVVEVGTEVRNFKVGDRITGCGAGGFAKYLVTSEDRFLFHLPDSLSFEEGALFEPLSACTHAVVDASGITPMDLALVTGPGSIGLCAMQVAKACGAVVAITGTAKDKERLALAEKLGAELAINIDEQDPVKLIDELSQHQGVDAVIECSGAQAAVDLGLKLIKNGKIYTQVGLSGKPYSVDLDHVVYNRLTIASSIGFRQESWSASIGLVERGIVNVKDIISHRFSLEDWEEGFRICENREGLKVLIIP